MLTLLLLISLCLISVNPSEAGGGYYEVLGVARHATSQQIRQAYKKLAVKLHPDKNPDPLEQEKFIKLSEAYETLKDPGKRQQYDLYGTFPSYTQRQDGRSRASYDHMFYNGLYANDPYVENITPNNFENNLSSGIYFINFYSPFCPPCQSLSEDWKNLAEEYHGVVGVAAVNCKYYNAFCYNRMRIHSYPTLQLYLQGSSVQYGRERAAGALRAFLTAQLWRAAGRGPEPHCQLRVATLGEHADARLAYLLMGVARVTVWAEEEAEGAECAGRLRCGAGREHCLPADAAGERGVLRAVAATLPRLATIHQAELARSAGEWAVLLRRRAAPDLELELTLRRLRATLTDLHYGLVECAGGEKDAKGVCGTLGAGEAAGWGVRKAGGAWQRVGGAELPELVRAVRRALRARSLHSLHRPPSSPAPRWVLGAEGARAQLEDAAAQLAHRTDLQFGLVHCEGAPGQWGAQWEGQWEVEAVCAEGAVEVRLGARRYRYRGEDTLSEYILTLLDSAVHAVPATEAQAWGAGAGGRQARLVAYMPARCHSCDTLSYQWARLADKLRALPHVWVGEVACGEGAAQGAGQGLCSNVHAAAARLYLAPDSAYHTTSLQALGEAAYMLQWALSLLPPAPRALRADTFHETRHRGRAWLVYFHSPRCRHCYEMFADFAIAAAAVSESASVGKVDCVSERALCTREGVRAYPELRVYAGGRVSSVPLRHHRLLLQDLRALLPATARHDEL